MKVLLFITLQDEQSNCGLINEPKQTRQRPDTPLAAYGLLILVNQPSSIKSNYERNNRSINTNLCLMIITRRLQSKTAN